MFNFNLNHRQTLIYRSKNRAMKRLLVLIICILSFPVSYLAQTSETFDLATFLSPKGWQKQVSQNSIQFSTAEKADYCLITLYKSVPGLNDPKENFDAAWETIVKKTVTPTAAPQMFPADNKEDWQLLGGFAPFEKDGEKGVAVLYTASGYGKMVNALVLTNTQAYEATATAFLNSISLKKLETIAKPQAESNAGNSAIVGQWGMSVSGQRNFEVNHGIAGYSTRQYTFNPNGTYLFVIKTFSYVSDKLLFSNETGTYQISGNNVTINPQKSVIQAWSKKDGTDKWGRLLSTQNKSLEKVTYQFSKHYFSGIQETNLVLKTDKATLRDGSFTANSDFPSSYLYAPVKYPIEFPR